MAFIVAGAAALGIAGLGFYVNPGRAEADEVANTMFRKPYDQCSPTEQQAVDLAHGIPKLEKLRDSFQSLFPKPKAKKSKAKATQQRRKNDSQQQQQDQQQSTTGTEQKGYALHDDKDILATYPVHEDTADPDQRYLADFSDLKHLVPFDIETESLEDAGTYDIEEYLKRNDRFPETFTLPRQLGGAATSANLLVNKLTEGGRAGLSEGYILPGHSPTDHVHPPTDEDLGSPPVEVDGSLQEAVDYRLGAGRYAKDMPDSVREALALRQFAEQQALEEGTEEGDEDEGDYTDEDDEDYSDEEEEEEEEVAVAVPRPAAAQAGRGAAVREPSESEEYDDEDDEDDDDY